MENFGYYVFVLIMIVVGFFIVKKVTTCLLKAIIGIAVIAILALVYYLYFAQSPVLQ